MSIEKYEKTIKFTVIVHGWYPCPSNIHVLSGVAIRANKKKGIPRTTYRDLIPDHVVKELIQEYKELVAKMIADEVIKQRDIGYTKEEKELLESKDLELQYNNLKSEQEQIDFLVKNEFKGIENLGYCVETPDGFGHTRCVSSFISFNNKSISKVAWSSDD